MSAFLTAIAPSIIGGLFGRKKKTQTTTTRVDYNHIRNAAAAAGFNPLTALRNGGSANATTTAPNLSSQRFMQESLTQGLNTWFNSGQAERDRELDEINLALAREELAQMQTGNRLMTGGGAGYDVANATGPFLPQTSGGSVNAPQPRNNIPVDGGSLMRGFEDTDGNAVNLPNSESGLEVSEVFGTAEVYNEDPSRWNREFGTALWNASPFIAPLGAAAGAYIGRRQIASGATMAAEALRRGAENRQTRRNVRSVGGGGMIPARPGQLRDHRFAMPSLDFF